MVNRRIPGRAVRRAFGSPVLFAPLLPFVVRSSAGTDAKTRLPQCRNADSKRAFIPLD